MIALVVAASGVPNPVGWAVDEVKGWIGGAASHGFQAIVGGLTTWMLDAVAWVAGGVFNFFLDATDPNVQADWFVGDRGPYATTAAIGAALLVGFLLVGVTQGVLAGDVGGMLRRVSLDLPMAVLGMVGLVTITQILIRLTDELSHGLLDQFADDVHRFTEAVGSVAGLTGGAASGFVVFLFALVCVLAGIVLVAELAIRSALIYIVVALAPLVFAAQLWPALRGAGRKLLELLVALIVSKLVVAVALAVAAAAAAGAGAGGATTTVLAPPEEAAQQGGSPAATVGILLAATAAFGVAAFSPLLVARLLPAAEAAGVASGIRGGPARAGQQGMSIAYYAHMAGGRSRLTSVAASPAAGMGASGGAAASGGSAATGSASAAAAGPAAAALAATKVATGAARTGIQAGTDTAAAASVPAPERSSASATSRSRPPAPKGGGHGQPS